MMRTVLGMFAVILMAMAIAPATDAQATEKRRTGNVCTADGECPDNAFCKGGIYCVCKDGFVYTAFENGTRACLKVSSFAGPCALPIQCQTSMGVLSECLYGTCSCKNYTQFVGNRCYKISRIGESCMFPLNCYIEDAPPEQQPNCYHGLCTCPPAYNPRDKGTRCVKDAALGERCLDHEQCAGRGQECHGTCQCSKGFTAYNESNVCLKLVDRLGDYCEYDEQCDSLSGTKDARSPGAAYCLGGACDCSMNARKAGDPPRCWNIKRRGQKCRVDEECLGDENEPGFCSAGKCTCKGCYPDSRDFTSKSTAVAAFPLVAAILAVAVAAIFV